MLIVKILVSFLMTIPFSYVSCCVLLLIVLDWIVAASMGVSWFLQALLDIVFHIFSQKDLIDYYSL